MSHLRTALLVPPDYSPDLERRLLGLVGYPVAGVFHDAEDTRLPIASDEVDAVIACADETSQLPPLDPPRYYAERGVAHGRIDWSALHTHSQVAVRRCLCEAAEATCATIQAHGITPTHSLFKTGKVFTRIRIADIRCVEAHRNYLTIDTEAATVRVRATLKTLCAQLPPGRFLKPHRSYLVARDAVLGLRRGFLVLEGRRVPVSDSGRPEVVAHFTGGPPAADNAERRRRVRREAFAYVDPQPRRRRPAAPALYPGASSVLPPLGVAYVPARQAYAAT